MWLIVGLGNPGSRYKRTRHNIGFLVLEEFAEKHGLTFSDRKDYRISRGSVENTDIILIEPLTFMNRSGTAVKTIMNKRHISPDNIIVIHDDLDLELGRIKIRKRGSSGGHRGVESIIQMTGSQDFRRLKIGIGRNELVPAETYVLSRFRKEELGRIRDAVIIAAEALDIILFQGIDRAMNRFN